MNSIDLFDIYRQMYRSRIFEEHVIQIWNDGLITGEMHTSIGEEAINAAVVTQLVDGDALALDHRGTSPSIIRGLDPKKLLLEFMGHPKGLCSGMGGHMHIFSRSHLLASSGIVGSSGPAAAGFALAAKQLRPGKIAVAFFGEGAVNEGMMMESFNLASVLKLPVLFVCKDNDMAITTVSSEVTAGKLIDRAEAFDMPAKEMDGTDVEIIWQTANEAIAKARAGEGPAFLLIKCKHFYGHFLGDPLLRIVKKPIKELRKITPGLLKSVTRFGGASMSARAGNIKEVLSLITRTGKNRNYEEYDPLYLLRKKLDGEIKEIEAIEKDVNDEMVSVVAEVLRIYMESNQE
jgi:acetoin:2,6-dichlorophenolindophenol oxidoreductase subunit alpha